MSRSDPHFEMVMKVFLVSLLILAATAFSEAQKFLPDDPVWIDLDSLPIPKPKARKGSQISDFMRNSMRPGPSSGDMTPAANVNTLGEVPDSSWFSNRMTKRTMSVSELVQGPNQTDGPDTSHPWTVISAKSEGITPGFTIRDHIGEMYFVKFDPLGHAQLATSAEVICTKFFHAFGYHVPENYIARIRLQDLEIGPKARITDEQGLKRKMAFEDLEAIFLKIPRLADGSVQALASQRLPGEPLGPFQYRGTRSDDANDIFPHEQRRELRGLRLFAAWLNHDDAPSINTLDMYLRKGETGYVKHHLIDFGSCLGSGTIKIQSRRAGNEYLAEWGPILKSAFTLGIWDRSWRKASYPSYPSIGRFEAEYFQPARWRPEYPNPAFQRMQPEDAFWAVRIMMRLNDEAIRAIVKTGQLEDPLAEDYLVETLIKRRDKIVRHYLSQIDPLDRFQVRTTPGESRLELVDLSSGAGLPPVAGYEYAWFSFNNQNGPMNPLTDQGSVEATSIPIPQDDSQYLVVQIQSLREGSRRKPERVRVFIRNREQPAVVGIDRRPFSSSPGTVK